MATPEAISVSQIMLYLSCSLKYRFQYIDRLPRLSKPSPLAFGSSVHAALEWLHKERKAGRQPTLDQLLRVFEADWYAQNLDQVDKQLRTRRHRLVSRVRKRTRLRKYNVPR